MIKIDKERFKIETDCKTVGEFMTQAAAFGCDRLVIKVDGCRYEFFNNPKIRVTDDTLIGSVTMDGDGDIVITTKPHPNTVTRHGWANLYHKGWIDGIIPGGRLFKTEEEAAASFDISIDCEKLATARVEWEEEIK